MIVREPDPPKKQMEFATQVINKFHERFPKTIIKSLIDLMCQTLEADVGMFFLHTRFNNKDRFVLDQWIDDKKELQKALKTKGKNIEMLHRLSFSQEETPDLFDIIWRTELFRADVVVRPKPGIGADFAFPLVDDPTKAKPEVIGVFAVDHTTQAVRVEADQLRSLSKGFSVLYHNWMLLRGKDHLDVRRLLVVSPTVVPPSPSRVAGRQT